MTTILSLIALVLLVGIVAAYTSGAPVFGRIGRVMSTIPIMSLIYSGARQAIEFLVDDSTRQFRDVQLVEFPFEGSELLGFVTASPTPCGRRLGRNR